MKTLDLSKLTAEQLLDRLPEEETTRWEFKDGDFLSKGKRGEFKTELGKQVSAFANSGGGYLVVGVSKTRQLAPTDQLTEGRQSMTDWLAQRTEQCVDPWIRDFHIHKLPLAGDASKAVYVVEVGDSVSAPHQAKDDLTYYYRIPGHSKPAPHFHLELLRNRMTKAVLSINTKVNSTLGARTNDATKWPAATLLVEVKNISLQSATYWGVLITSINDNNRFTCEGRWISRGVCVHGRIPILMPMEGDFVHLVINAQRGNHAGGLATVEEIDDAWKDFGAVVRPVTQNFVGEERHIGWHDDAAKWRIQRGLMISALVDR